MGGTVAVSIRLTDDLHGEDLTEVVKMARWTNTLPWFFCHRGFVEKSRDHIDQYLQQWQDMKEDWGKNGPNGPFEFNMTPVYHPYSQLAPTEYGLVVVDYQTNTILTMQGYCNLDTMSRLSLRLQSRKHGEQMSKDDLEDLENVEWFLSNNRAEIFHWVSGTIEKFSGNINDLEALLVGSGFSSSIFKADLSPWSIEEFSEDLEGSEVMLSRIRDLGFVLTSEDLQGWEEWLDYHREMEAEDDD